MDLKKELPQLTKEQEEIIDFWSVRGYEQITHCLGMSISLHLKDRYVHNGLCLQYLEQFRDKYLKQSKTMQDRKGRTGIIFDYKEQRNKQSPLRQKARGKEDGGKQ